MLLGSLVFRYKNPPWVKILVISDFRLGLWSVVILSTWIFEDLLTKDRESPVLINTSLLSMTSTEVTQDPLLSNIFFSIYKSQNSLSRESQACSRLPWIPLVLKYGSILLWKFFFRKLQQVSPPWPSKTENAWHTSIPYDFNWSILAFRQRGGFLLLLGVQKYGDSILIIISDYPCMSVNWKPFY